MVQIRLSQKTKKVSKAQNSSSEGENVFTSRKLSLYQLTTTKAKALIFPYDAYTRLIFKYPFYYGENTDFLMKLCNFIAKDLSNNVYYDLSYLTNFFFIQVENEDRGEFKFVDKFRFYEYEKEYFSSIGDKYITNYGKTRVF